MSPSTTRRSVDGDDAEQPQDPERTQHRQPLRRRDQGDGDDGEIEQVPAVAEEPRPLDIDLRGEFEHEDRETQPVECQDERPEPCHRGLRGFDAKNQGVEQDDGENEVTECPMLDQAVQAFVQCHNRRPRLGV